MNLVKSRSILSGVLLIFFLFGLIPVYADSVIESAQIRPLPFDVTTGVTIEVSVAENRPDVSIEYHWLINGEENLFEKSTHLPGNLFKRGDMVEVEITPVTYAGERLPSIVSRPFEAMNAPPVITSEPPEELTESGFRYQVTASDPDGDPLIFKLESAPDTMAINASDGLIQWAFVTMPEGVFPVIISVEDDHGGQAEQSFELQMTYEDVIAH